MKFHIHMLLTCRIYLNNDSDCDRFACQFMVLSFFGSVVSICYITLGWVREMLYLYFYCVTYGWVVQKYHFCVVITICERPLIALTGVTKSKFGVCFCLNVCSSRYSATLSWTHRRASVVMPTSAVSQMLCLPCSGTACLYIIGLHCVAR